MAVTLATFGSGDWNTQNTLSRRLIFEQFLDPHKTASPTWKIMLANKQTVALGPDEEFHIPVVTHDYSPSIATKNDRFPTDDIDNITEQKWSIVRLKNGAGTNAVDMKHYANPTALMNHIDQKVNSIHKGTTQSLNYLQFSDWNETRVDDRINIASELSGLPVPPDELYLNDVTDITQLPYSLPMAARTNTTGHTFGNLSTANNYWVPEVTDGAGVTVNRSAAGDNIDMVTSIAGALVALDLDDLGDHLAKMQTGQEYTFYAPVGRDIFAQLRNIILAMNIRQHDSPVADLGIRSTITWDEYNVTFYHEPMMDALWPSTIWFFDPDCWYLKVDEGFDPTGGTGIWDWERIPGSIMYGTMIYLIFQFVCEDRRGVGAMHGFTKD